MPLVLTAFTGTPVFFYRFPHCTGIHPSYYFYPSFYPQIHQKCEEGVEDIEKLGIPSAVQLMLSTSDKNTQQLIAEAQKEFESTYFFVLFRTPSM